MYNIASFYRVLWRETHFMNVFYCILRFWSKRHSILSTVYLPSLDFHGLLSWLTSKAAALLKQRAFGSKSESWILKKHWNSKCTRFQLIFPCSMPCCWILLKLKQTFPKLSDKFSSESISSSTYLALIFNTVYLPLPFFLSLLPLIA